jgi:CBS domain containing-hemolysin-like protein
LAEAIARRLRGGEESLAWLATTERLVVGATAATSLGVTLVGVAIPALFGRVTLAQLALLVLVVVIPATLLGGYLLPRWLTVPKAEQVVGTLSPILAAWHGLLGWVLPGGGHAASEDIRHLAREGTANGLAEGGELVMVGGVMSFAERPVREVMTPRTEVVAVPDDADYDTVFATFVESGYTRLPVYRGTLDEIVGMVHAFDLFKLRRGEPLPRREVSFAPEQLPVGDVLLEMQRERRHFVVVVDEFGGTAGIITFEDLLEALVGEIADEDDDEPEADDLVQTADLLEADGDTSVGDVEAHFDVDLAGNDATTVAGRLVELAGRIPQAGERFLLAGLEVDVLEATPVRVERLLIRRPVGPPQELTGGRP